MRQGGQTLSKQLRLRNQGGRNAHIWLKPFKYLLQSRKADIIETWYTASALKNNHVYSNVDPRMTFDFFIQRSILVPIRLHTIVLEMVDYSGDRNIEVYDIIINVFPAG